MQKKSKNSASFPHDVSGKGAGAKLYDIILGGQDGVVNVLGLVLGVAGATSDTRIVLISGLASTFAESISMAAVAYTSSKAARDYYRGELAREKMEIIKLPEEEKQEIRDIYSKKGFKGSLLNKIVAKITSNKKMWLYTMMTEELKLSPENHASPLINATRVGLASLAGSIIPIMPFFFLPVKEGMYAAVLISIAVLFVTGAIKAKVTIGVWWKSGIEMSAIGILAALAGYWIGVLLGSVPL